jgi:hypothetical protein
LNHRFQKELLLDAPPPKMNGGVREKVKLNEESLPTAWFTRFHDASP